MAAVRPSLASLDVLKGLKDRVESETGPCEATDIAVIQAIWSDIGECAPHCAGDAPIFFQDPLHKRRPPRLTDRLDAAVWLIRTLLPGWDYRVESAGYLYEETTPGIAYGVVKNTPRHREALVEMQSPRPSDGAERRGMFATTHWGANASTEPRALLAAVLSVLIDVQTGRVTLDTASNRT